MNDSKIIELFFARNQDAIRHTDEVYGKRLLHLADRIVGIVSHAFMYVSRRRASAIRT